MVKKVNNNIEVINQKRLIRLFRDTINNGEKEGDGIRFCFLLGAGASVGSGIESGGSLAKKWYKELTEDIDKDELIKWRKSKKVKVNDLASSYPEIFEKRFIEQPQVGFHELQQLMGNADPSIGYLILAKILSETRHSFVITTNFDHLVEDALFIATTKRPLVCGHESLAPYVHSQSQRPTIIKVHRDLLLDPFNQTKNTSILHKEWVKALTPILKDFHLVVLGYGGNDGSLMDYLADIPVEQRKKIFWCERNPENINENILNVLKNEGGKLVQIDGFDELMYELNAVCEIEDFIDLDNLEESPLIQNARKKADIYRAKLDELGSRAKQQMEKGNPPSKALEKLLPDWWEITDKANREEDFSKSDLIYEEGLQALSNSENLYESYAWNLIFRPSRYDRLEKIISKLDEIAPNSAVYLKSVYLCYIRKDLVAGENILIEFGSLDSNNPYMMMRYADFLVKNLNGREKAEQLLKKVMEHDTSPSEARFRYARLLEINGKIDEAKKYFEQSLELNPSDFYYNLGFGAFLTRQGHLSKSDKYFKAARELAIRPVLRLWYWYISLVCSSNNIKRVKKELDALLKMGLVLPLLDPSQHLDFAKKNNHKYLKELEFYSVKLTTLDHNS